jgi:hypothetical protein
MKASVKVFCVAVAIGCLFGTVAFAGTAVPILTNPGFESPNLPLSAQSANPAYVPGWTFAAGAQSSGVDNSAPFGYNEASASGYQHAFLWGVNSSATASLQNLTVGDSYVLSFKAMDTTFPGFSGDTFQASLNGTAISYNGSTVLSPGSASYTTYTTTFTATATTAAFAIKSLGSTFGFVDDVQISGLSLQTNLVTNGYFEDYQLNSGGRAAATQSGWSFTGNAVLANGNTFQVANTVAAFSGSQYGLIEGAGDTGGVSSISRTISGLIAGQQYRLSFESEALLAEGSTGLFIDKNPLTVSMGASTLSFGGAGNTTVSPSGAWEYYVSDVFTATSDTMTLKFADAGNQSALAISMVDNVVLNAVPEPGTVALLIGAAVAGCALWLRRR